MVLSRFVADGAKQSGASDPTEQSRVAPEFIFTIPASSKARKSEPNEEATQEEF
jgi:hypothetical protein